VSGCSGCIRKSNVLYFVKQTILGKKAEATAKLSLETCNKKISDQLANRDFIYLLLVLRLFEKLKVFILLTAVGSNFSQFLLFIRNSNLT
jgi:hypothetical protein